MSLLTQIALLAAAFGAGVGLAELFGAADLGVAFGIGQLAFVAALAALLLKGRT
jgi:hypothetical protein